MQYSIYKKIIKCLFFHTLQIAELQVYGVWKALKYQSSDCLMMQSEIVCGRQMSARASTAAAWLVAIQIKKNARKGILFTITYSV